MLIVLYMSQVVAGKRWMKSICMIVCGLMLGVGRAHVLGNLCFDLARRLFYAYGITRPVLHTIH